MPPKFYYQRSKYCQNFLLDLLSDAFRIQSCDHFITSSVIGKRLFREPFAHQQILVNHSVNVFRPTTLAINSSCVSPPRYLVRFAQAKLVRMVRVELTGPKTALVSKTRWLPITFLHPDKKLVRIVGFEPTTSSTRNLRSTKLSYILMVGNSGVEPLSVRCHRTVLPIYQLPYLEVTISEKTKTSSLSLLFCKWWACKDLNLET